MGVKMNRIICRFALAVVAVGLLSRVEAQTVAYRLDAAASTVAFEADFGPDLITGAIPLQMAELTLDFADAAKCRIVVELDVRGAMASFPFAAQALKGPKVLAAAEHPTIRFDSTLVRRVETGAEVEGMLTIRGVTRPVVLQAQIYRPNGSATTDYRRLTVRLTGHVNRSDFGATGWADMVGDEVRIIITARIEAKG